jgi:hypothetical protein
LPDDGFSEAETCSKRQLKSINPLYTVNVKEILKGCCVVTDKGTINAVTTNMNNPQLQMKKRSEPDGDFGNKWNPLSVE